MSRIDVFQVLKVLFLTEVDFFPVSMFSVCGSGGLVDLQDQDGPTHYALVFSIFFVIGSMLELNFYLTRSRTNKISTFHFLLIKKSDFYKLPEFIYLSI